MTDKKISELTNITGANVDDANDELAIVDASTATTKAITRGELFKDYARQFSSIDEFNSSSLIYENLPSGDTGGDNIMVNGQAWITLPSTDTLFYEESVGGVKARRDAPIKIVVIAGQSNAQGVNDGGPNPASTLVQTWNADTGVLDWGGSDYTAAPWTSAGPIGNGGNNNYALARAHRLADDEGYAVGIVYDAVSGTSIDEWVASGTSSTRYAALKTNVENALAEIPGKAVVDEIIWAQGEEDFADDFATHLGNLTLLRNQLRDETWCDWDTPIYMMGPSDLHDRYQWQNAMQYFCGRVDSRCIFVPSNGLRTEYQANGVTDDPGTGDFTHFLGESLWEAGYYRIAEAAPVEVPPQYFYGRGTGPALPSDDTVLASFESIVSRESWTSETPPNGPAASGSISWGFECVADGNYSFALGYQCETNNLTNYTLVAGRDVTTTANCDYSAGFGYQVSLDADYSFATGRGHTVSDGYGVALGGWSAYTSAQGDPVRLQVGVGSSSGSRQNGLTVRESGTVEIYAPSTANDPEVNEEIVFKRVDNTTLRVLMRGADGTVRSADLTLS